MEETMDAEALIYLHTLSLAVPLDHYGRHVREAVEVVARQANLEVFLPKPLKSLITVWFYAMSLAGEGGSGEGSAY